jgi:dienelactone hydrolase
MIKKLGVGRISLFIVSLLFIAVAWWRVLDAPAGLEVRHLEQDGLPLRYVGPENGRNLPGVLIAHGFSASQQIMLAFAYELAHAGYGVMLWDFAGHATNRAPIAFERADDLQANIDTAYDSLAAQPEIDPGRIALLGHSMGSGAVMQAGIENPQRYQATIAISPTGAEVTPQKPRNFLLMAEALMPQFVSNAEALLADAGGENDDFANGLARKLVIAPNVEHLSILFSGRSHNTAREWLDRTFGQQPAAPTNDYQDWRIAWYGLHLLGWLGVVLALAPLLAPRPLAAAAAEPPTTTRRAPWHWLALVFAPILASSLLFSANLILNVSQLLGLLVGGGLALWFLFMGGFWLLAGFRPPRPDWHSLGWGLVLFAVLWLAFGALGQVVWLPWLLIPERLWRWPILALAFIPWLLAAGLVLQNSDWRRKAAWWLFQSLAIIAGLLSAVALVPSLFFLVLIIALLPLVLALMIAAGSIFQRPWAFAVGNALFFSWLLLAVFPLTG